MSGSPPAALSRALARAASSRPSRSLTVIAQDPSVRYGSNIVRSAVELPAENLGPGPCGYRVCIIDYDTSTGRLYAPVDLGDGDPFEKASDDELLANPHFHQQNVYAVVMSTLARFEHALGRRVSWSMRGHQLKVAPHAFADANAFYSEIDEALMFGYIPRRNGNGTVFTCLSHDVIAHETTHAIVDGLRTRYTDPSSPDQAAFHEGFADVVALLSVLAQPGVARLLVPDERGGGAAGVTREALKRTAIIGLAEEMGEEIQGARGKPLRCSLDLEPSPDLLATPEFLEPHRRGEVFVAAVLGAFFDVWAARVDRMAADGTRTVDRSGVVEAGADIADRLLTLCIRALDYTPAVDVQFSDFMVALLTADTELFPDDRKYEFRTRIRDSFGSFGIVPPDSAPDGLWLPVETAPRYDRSHSEPLQRDRDEMFRFVWENRVAFDVNPHAYCEVISVRPCLRQGRDGFFLRETVVEYVEILRLRADELGMINLRMPDRMARDRDLPLYGGGTLIFDEFLRLKYHVKSYMSGRRQQARLDYLACAGPYRRATDRHFAELHLQRATAATTRFPESW
jgi:hypothetical protein